MQKRNHPIKEQVSMTYQYLHPGPVSRHVIYILLLVFDLLILPGCQENSPARRE